MADDDAKSAKSKFKSKWHRVFREKEDHELTPQHTNSFKLQDDVHDFLKPSTDNANTLYTSANTNLHPQVPKLDVAIAQRWPTAHEVRAASATGGPFTPNGFTKPKRRKGLVVGFVRTEPEIIGEGGDECEEPAVEVGRRREMMGMHSRPRAVTYGAPTSSAAQGAPFIQTQPIPVPGAQDMQTPEQVSAPVESVGSSFEAPPLRRVQTTPSDYSPQMERARPVSIVDENPPQLPRLSRTPTGGSSNSDFSFGTFRLDSSDAPPVPQIDTTLVEEREPTLPNLTPLPNSALSASPRDPSALAARKRELASGEGMILRRASALIKPADLDDDDAQKRESMGFGVQPSSQAYETLSRPDAPSLLPEVPPTPRSARTPSSAAAISPSPFADPKYLRHHSREGAGRESSPLASTAVLSQSTEQQVQSQQAVYELSAAPAPAPAAKSQSSFTEKTSHWAPVPTVQPLRTSDEIEPSAASAKASQYLEQSTAPQRPVEQQARLNRKPAMQDLPSRFPPPFSTAQSVDQPRHDSETLPPQRPSISTAPPPELKYQRPFIGEDQLTNMRIASSSDAPPREKTSASSEPTSARPSPSGSSRYFVKPGESPRSRDPSPRSAIPTSDSATSEKYYGQIYNRPNGSNTNLEFAPPPPPGFSSHSRSSSRDSLSAGAQQSAGSGGRSPVQRAPPGFTSNPQNQSPRSSMYGKPAFSGSGTNLSPDDYTQRMAAAPTGRSPLQYVHRDDASSASSRPGTSGSNPAPQRGAPKSSSPRIPQTAQSEQARWSGAYLLQADNARPSSTDSNGSGRLPRANENVPVLQAPQARPGQNQRPQAAPRSMSGTSAPAQQRPNITPQPSSEGNPAADAAYADFASRVAHMKGVFRLTAEKERPMDRCTPLGWLRTALWWYLGGKVGLEALLRNRPRSNDGQVRELLMQAHVDLAKAWWIISDALAMYDCPPDKTPDSASSNSPEIVLRQSIGALKSYMKSLCLSMGRSQLMPPPASLIQGQDTVIWLDYPRFPPGAISALSGYANSSQSAEYLPPTLMPLDALPLGDDRDTFCYGRFPVDLALNSDDPSTDRMAIPCILTMLRSKDSFGTSITIASQSELVNLKVTPKQGKGESLTWFDVSWKSNPHGMAIRLDRNFDVNVRMQEKDFRALFNMLKYAEKIEDNLRPDHGERILYEAELAELQFADSSNNKAFPPDKIRRARAIVFERTAHLSDAGGGRKLHRGYRLALLTSPRNKSLACVSQEVGRQGPILFEFITDSAANGMVAMVIRVREESRQCRILMVFPDVALRQNFFDVINGVMVGPHEAIVGKMGIAGLNIEPALQARSVMQEIHPALRALQWQRLGVTNGVAGSANGSAITTVQSESLRIIARHTTGCITDRLNLGKGELLLRLPCADIPAIQILRNPQDDIGVSIDTRNTDPSIIDGFTTLAQALRQQSTVRTYSFTSYDELHAFQGAITGCQVDYDGLAATFSISRRRMVVPIYKKWEASKVRLQIVSWDTVVQVVAFMEDFSHTDAMCFQVKSTDVFENSKEGHGKGKMFAVKLVDAKFSLPRIVENHNDEGVAAEDAAGRARRRFVNLEGLEYKEEHDDITIGFETQEERDRFAAALPAAATMGRGITLKRRT